MPQGFKSWVFRLAFRSGVCTTHPAHQQNNTHD